MLCETACCISWQRDHILCEFSISAAIGPTRPCKSRARWLEVNIMVAIGVVVHFVTRHRPIGASVAQLDPTIGIHGLPPMGDSWFGRVQPIARVGEG